MRTNAAEIFIPEPVLAVMEALEGAGFPAYLVGGAVRDSILGRPVGDYDLTTSATPEEMEDVFAGWRVIETGIRHGTLTILSGSCPVEVTTFRTDGEYTDHRRPDQVLFGGSLEDDLARRDFTINAMAYHPLKGLIDPYDGRKDLAGGLLRCVGKPGVKGEAGRRFDEDALRILRALRFASQLGFALEEETREALLARKGLLTYIAAERIRAEMDKLLLGPHAARILIDYAEVIAVFIPEMADCIGFEQHTEYHSYDVWAHCAHAAQNAFLSPNTRAALAEKGEDEHKALLQVKWAAMLHDIEKPACFFTTEDGNGHFYGHSEKGAETVDRILERLRFDRASRDKIVFLVANHDRQFVLQRKPVLRAIRRYGKADLLLLMDIYSADCSAQSPLAYERLRAHDLMRAMIEDYTKEKDLPFSRADLAVDGRDVMALGYEGPAVGEALEKLLDGVLNGTVANEKEALLAFLQRGETDNQ